MNGLKKAISIVAKIFAVFLIVAIIGGIAQGVFSIFSDGKGIDFGGHREKNSSHFSQEYIDELDGYSLVAELKATDVTINYGDEFEYNTNNKFVTVEQENGKIIIKETKLANNTSSSKLELTVPKDKSFSNVDFANGAGDVVINGLNTEKLDFELGTGNVTVNGLIVTDGAEIDCGIGDFTVNGGVFNDLELNLGIGNVEINVLGSLNDYTVNIGKIMGDVNVGGKKMSGDSIIGNGSQNIEINGGLGNVNVFFDRN